ncbi:MAG: transketolase [Syntrophomonadaceae bacterium]|nr:transketolase [Syntrophomonadaceae bacterium]MDD3022837.1 transketolase [Syntrophomonadaceae bacterium]
MKKIDEQVIAECRERARLMRRDIISMLSEAGSGHSGGSLSAADIVACLYYGEMNIDPGRPAWEERDRFVLSKGHAAPVLYAALAQKGFFPQKYLSTLRKLGSPLQGHPDCNKLAGVEACSGSLGQGISWAVGMALAGKMDKKDYRVYALLGDGEIEEGIVWEAVMAAGHYKLDNLLAIVDNNGLQIDGRIEDIMSPEPIGDKFRAFGWEVISVDGHDHRMILEALRRGREVKARPTVIVAQTIKGKGCSFMEDRVEWHGSTPNKEEADQALAELV